MPRKKLENKGDSWKRIDKAMKKEKNCLQAELLLKEPLTPLQAHTLQSYCKFAVGTNREQISFNTRNSWKGLIMACLSIAYCKYGCSFISMMVKTQQYLNTKVAFNYSILSSLLEDSGAQNTIEKVAIPPSWKPCYVLGAYTAKEVSLSMERIPALLGLDTSKSIVKVSQSTTPNVYKSYPEPCPQQESPWRVSDFVECVEGIALVSERTMDRLFGDRRAMGVPHQVNPQGLVEWSSEHDDPGKPVALFGYEISLHSVKQLCTYFPFLETDLIHLARKYSQLGKSAWIVFDSKHLGKWG